MARADKLLQSFNQEPDCAIPKQSDSSFVSQVFEEMEDNDIDLPYYDAELNCTDSDLEVEETLEENPEQLLQSSLVNWALEFGVTSVALTALLSVLRPFHQTLPKDARTLLKTPNDYKIENIGGGTYFYFGILNSISGILQGTWQKIPSKHVLKLQLNFDGLPLHKSTNMQLWPILGKIQELHKKPFIIGIFAGTSKPTSLSEYLKDLVTEVKSLRSGFIFNGKQFFLQIGTVICDAPARAYIKGIKSHSGYNGCDKCIQSGIYLQNRMTFPETSSVLRTDESFSEMCDEDHHLTTSPLVETGLGMVSGFPHDYMHLVCLGVMRRLLDLWICGPLRIRLPAQKVKTLSENLVSLQNHTPCEFARKPRSVAERNRWKATELRQFLLYTGAVVLFDVLSTPVYQNFLLISVAISVLASPSVSAPLCDFAKTLVISFVEHFGQLYGKEQLVYNVHCLVHLCDDVKRHGHLDGISGFPFENCLGQIKKMIRRPQFPVAQIVRRVAEMTHRTSLGTVELLSGWHPRKQHHNGPVPLFTSEAVLEYKEIISSEFCLKITEGDNCFKCDETIGLVQNVVMVRNDCYLVYKEFRCVGAFYEYPIDSQIYGTYLLSNLSRDLKVLKFDANVKKYVLLPFKDQFVGIPLLHLQ